jgi:hypothetical protein
MGEIKTLASRKYSELRVVIDIEDFPNEEKIEETKKVVIEKFSLDLEKFRTGVFDVGYGRRRLDLYLRTRKTVEDEPIVAALEVFLQLLGNIRIYSKTISYGRE